MMMIMRTATPASLILLLLAVIPSSLAFSTTTGRPEISSPPPRKLSLVQCNLWPFKMSSSSSADEGTSGGGQHLVRAGQHLHTAAESVGPENYACPRLLKDAGDSISEIGEYWTESWEAVTYAAEDASHIFHSLAQLQGSAQPELAKLYSASSNELREIASIVGCTSVGPPTAAPNLDGLSHNLKEAAKYVEQCGTECSEDGRAFGKSLRKASRLILALAKEYDY